MSRLTPLFSAKLAVLLSAVFVTVGCNTEMRWDDGQTKDGLTTRMDRPEGVDVPDIQVADAKEVDIVEDLLQHRARYRKLLEVLRDYYTEHGYHTKQKWAEAELADLNHVKPYKYILSAEIPMSRLHPRYAVAEADAMYQQGLDLMRKGGHGVPALYNRQYMRQALDVFTNMIKQYPESDKIDDAAFCCGEILKEYFNNCETLAVKWYERCRTWDPKSPHPALFQAAVLYDYRLHDRAKALELYHRVLEEETLNGSNTAFASRRIYELTDGMKQLEQPRRPIDGDFFAAPAASAPPQQAQPVSPAPEALGGNMTTNAPAQRDMSNQSSSAYAPSGNMEIVSMQPVDRQPVQRQPVQRPETTQRRDDNGNMVPIVNLGPDD